MNEQIRRKKKVNEGASAMHTMKEQQMKTENKKIKKLFTFSNSITNIK